MNLRQPALYTVLVDHLKKKKKKKYKNKETRRFMSYLLKQTR